MFLIEFQGNEYLLDICTQTSTACVETDIGRHVGKHIEMPDSGKQSISSRLILIHFAFNIFNESIACSTVRPPFLGSVFALLPW